jgi:DASS family divalent anion:Na+ symporter
MNISLSAWQRLLSYIAIALLLMFFTAPPVGVDVIGWRAFIIFATTLLLVITKVYDMGVVSLIALSLLVATQTVSLDEALMKFSYSITWLVVLAFFIAKGFVLSGLGTRIALGLSAYVGSTPLRLAYALIGAEVLMAPFIPSNTARGGGLVYPVAQSLGDNIFGKPQEGEKHYRQWNAFLLYSCFQANLISSALFLTAMAGNPIIANLASDMGFELTWVRWFSGGCVPAFVALLLTPLILKALIRPSQPIPEGLTEHTKAAYAKLGPVSSRETIMGFTFIFLLSAWVLGPLIGIHPTAAALFAVSILLAAEVMSWHDLATDHHAWTTYVWLTVLFTLTTVMKDHGFVQWAANEMAKAFPPMEPKWLLAALMAVNFYSHYFFASLTSHITTIFHPLLLIGLQMHIPLQPLVYGLAFSTSLSGGLTHYGTGAGTIVYGAGYWNLKEWWLLGLCHSSIVLALFILLGFPLWF